MRRCYRSAALVLGGILLASPLLNSCGLGTLNVYAAEAARPEKTMVIRNRIQTGSNYTGEENVDTEIPAENLGLTFSVMLREEKNEKSFDLEYNEYDLLLKIVEAEAGGEDLTGKMLVANVIMNRVTNDSFPNTVTEVVYQKSNGCAQFSPTVDGRLETVTVSQETVDAVERVMYGDDSSNGALFFRSVHSKGKWHDRALTRILEHGNHIFYTF